MLQEKQVWWLAVALGAAVLCGPSRSFAARRAPRAVKTSQSTQHTASVPRYLHLRVASEQVFRKSGEVAVPESRGPLLVSFQTSLVRLSADDYLVYNERILLLGHAAVTCEAGGQPLNISSEQLELSWNSDEHLPGDTVIEAQVDAGDTCDSTALKSGVASDAVVPDAAKALPLLDTKLPLAAKPLSLLLRLLVDESSNNGRFLQDYTEGAKLTVSRYVVKFSGFSDSYDSGGYSEDGQLIYDQRKRVLFLEARTSDSWQKKTTLLQLTLADVTMARLGTLLREGMAPFPSLSPLWAMRSSSWAPG